MQPLIVKLSETDFVNLAQVTRVRVYDRGGTVRVWLSNSDNDVDYKGAEAARLLAALNTLANERRDLTDAGDTP